MSHRGRRSGPASPRRAASSPIDGPCQAACSVPPGGRRGRPRQQNWKAQQPVVGQLPPEQVDVFTTLRLQLSPLMSGEKARQHAGEQAAEDRIGAGQIAAVAATAGGLALAADARRQRTAGWPPSWSMVLADAAQSASPALPPQFASVKSAQAAPGPADAGAETRAMIARNAVASATTLPSGFILLPHAALHTARCDGAGARSTTVAVPICDRRPPCQGARPGDAGRAAAVGPPRRARSRCGRGRARRAGHGRFKAISVRVRGSSARPTEDAWRRRMSAAVLAGRGDLGGIVPRRAGTAQDAYDVPSSRARRVAARAARRAHRARQRGAELAGWRAGQDALRRRAATTASSSASPASPSRSSRSSRRPTCRGACAPRAGQLGGRRRRPRRRRPRRTTRSRLVEGFLRKEWGEAADGWARARRRLQPAFSLENTGPAWTPRYTLTPSALNTWLWEEGPRAGRGGRMVGHAAGDSQLERVRRHGLGTRPAGHPAGAARLGAERLPQRHQQRRAIPSPGGGRRTCSTSATAGRRSMPAAASRDPWKIGKLRARLLRQPRRPRRRRACGRRATAIAGVAPAAAGRARHPVPVPDRQHDDARQRARAARFRRSIRWSRTAGASTASAFRYDNFRVAGRRRPADRPRERGYAFTVGYLFEFWLRHRVGFEYIIVDSDRATAASEPCRDDGWQLSYRFRY